MLQAYYYRRDSEQFRHPKDRYEGWSMISVQTGKFAFSFSLSPETTGTDGMLEGIAEFGELVFCPPGTAFNRRLLERSSFHFAEFKPGFAPPVQPGVIRLRDVTRLRSTYDYMIRLRDENPAGMTPELEHLVGDLLFLVGLEEQAAQARKRRDSDPLMHRAAALLEEQACREDFALHKLAAQLGLRGPQLSLRFQAAYAQSPIQFATAVRLAKACKRLIETDDTLEAIADSCGYQNAFYFSRVFSKNMRISPSLFRRANRI